MGGAWLDKARRVDRDGSMRRAAFVCLALTAVLVAGCGRQIPLPRNPLARAPRVPESNLPILNEEAFEDKPMRAYRIPTPQPGKIPEQTVIGEMATHRIRQGETL